MRRLVVVVSAVALVGVVLAAWGGSASARHAEPTGPNAAEQKPKLPALPANIKQRGRFNIAIKCDSPPFGYIDVRGRNAGFDVEIARWFSRFAFGKPNRVNMSCVTTPAREPALTSDRADMVIATFTYTADRDTRIDFSRAYYKATGRILAREQRPQHLPLAAGREDDRDHDRLDLRPLDEELLQGHEGRGHGQLHERVARVPQRACGRAHVGRHRPARDRRSGPDAEADRGPVPRRCRTASGSSRGTPR